MEEDKLVRKIMEKVVSRLDRYDSELEDDIIVLLKRSNVDKKINGSWYCGKCGSLIPDKK